MTDLRDVLLVTHPELGAVVLDVTLLNERGRIEAIREALRYLREATPGPTPKGEAAVSLLQWPGTAVDALPRVRRDDPEAQVEEVPAMAHKISLGYLGACLRSPLSALVFDEHRRRGLGKSLYRDAAERIERAWRRENSHCIEVEDGDCSPEREALSETLAVYAVHDAAMQPRKKRWDEIDARYQRGVEGGRSR